MIDICDFAVGLSRQLYGLTIASERAAPPHDGDLAPARRGRRHLGVQLPGRGVGVERGAGAGLRRPVRVEAVGEDAADRAALAGAVRPRGAEVRRRAAGLPLRVRRRARGRPALVDDRRVPLVSATGSTRDGPRGRAAVAARFGRACSSSAATTARSSRRRPTWTWRCAAIVFAAVGTAGQRCTTLRRLIVHESRLRRAGAAG
jgi:aldehyde dehydrogenase (NAD+)